MLEDYRMQSRFASSVDMEPCQLARFGRRALPEGCRIALRGLGQGGKRRRGERSSRCSVVVDRCGGGFAGAGGWRSASVFTREGGICVSAVFASRVLSRFSKSDAPPQEIHAACLYHDDC